MAERVVKVTLTAQVAQYAAAMDEAARKTATVGSESEKLAQKRQAFQMLGTGLLAVGGAMTALTVSVIKTGVAYNTLQQTTRAALSTLLGGSKQANEQMDKLDAFARNSPFSKTVFIAAQQQMLGFGVAAKDVIPALDAIQNAVAAMGGGNDQIRALAEIMARVKSEGRLSGDALQRLGYYGIDAAQIIGSQMGKTAVEIRDMASRPGGIPVGQIWDPLVNGLQEKFGGAAANVKLTFAGAMDRVKAAWRDLSADLAKPLVDPNGGGLFVDLLNQLADVMRRFQALPEPVKLAGGAIFGLVGVTALAGGAFIAAVPKVAAYRAALETLGTGAQRTSRVLGILAKTAVVATAFVALAKGAELAAKGVGLLGEGAKTANETTSRLLDRDYDGLFKGVALSIGGLSDALDRLLATDPGTAFNRWGSDLFAFTGFTSSVGEAREQFTLLGEALAEMVNNGQGDRAAQIFEELTARAEEQGYSVDQLNDLMPAYKDALTGVSNESKVAEGAVDGVSSSLTEQEKASEDLLDALKAVVDAYEGLAHGQMSVSEAHDDALESINKLKDAAEAEGATLDGVTDASIKFRDSLRDVEQKHYDSAKAIIENGGTLADARKEWDAGREAVVKMLQAKGLDEKAARAWADKNLGSARDVELALAAVKDQADKLPDKKTIKTEVVGDEVLKTRLQQLKDKLASIPNVKRITLESYTVGNRSVSAPNANGGIYQGKVKAFASGGVEPAIYPFTAGGIHKFAEEYAEAYISMDPRRRSRSEQVWQQVGSRFGFSQPGVDPRAIGAAVRDALDGMSVGVHGEVGPDGIIRLVDGRISRVLPSAGQVRSVYPY